LNLAGRPETVRKETITGAHFFWVLFFVRSKKSTRGLGQSPIFN
jgi:hypothetical protein